ncbi:DMT family transporter [Luteolibacter marinus]|uniref:DMT family transporter n=1 Tax=Luteolibacter marinus TaxID=2776705 RepID=UPI001866E34C|nr:DMT family transporter [Luteolibacter marinus]
MPVVFLVLACAFWGLSFPIVKALDLEQSARLPGMSKAFFAAWLQMARFGVACLLMAPFLFRFRPTRGEAVQAAWLALWGGLGMALQAWGLAFTEASTSAFLTQAYCVILPLIACLKTRRAPSPRTLLATALVVVGGAVLSGVRPDALRMGKGEVATLAAAFVFTFQILTLETPKHRANRGLVVTFLMCGFISLLFFPVALLLAPQPSALVAAAASWPTASLVLALALLCSVAAFSLMNTWQPRVSATEAGLIYTTEPVFTAVFVMFLPAWLGSWVGESYQNESLTLSLITGGSLILAANVLMQWKRPPHPPAIAPIP